MYFSASYYPLALPLRKPFQYIPCSVVSTLFKNLKLEGLPLSDKAVASTWTCPFAGDFSLTFIGRPLPWGRAAIALCPSKSFSLVRLKQQNKTTPTHKKKKEGKKKKKVLDHLYFCNLSPWRSVAESACSGAASPTGLRKSDSQKLDFSHKQKIKISLCCQIQTVC